MASRWTAYFRRYTENQAGSIPIGRARIYDEIERAQHQGACPASINFVFSSFWNKPLDFDAFADPIGEHRQGIHERIETNFARGSFFRRGG